MTLARMIVVLSILIFSFANTTLAFESTISANTKVNNVAGFIEKFKERINLFLKTDHNAKVDYYGTLVDKRLAELVYIIETNQMDYMDASTSRYATYIATLNSYVDNEISNENRTKLISMLKNHIQVLEAIQSQYRYESGWWILIQHDINSAKDLLAKLESSNN